MFLMSVLFLVGFDVGQGAEWRSQRTVRGRHDTADIRRDLREEDRLRVIRPTTERSDDGL